MRARQGGQGARSRPWWLSAVAPPVAVVGRRARDAVVRVVVLDEDAQDALEAGRLRVSSQSRHTARTVLTEALGRRLAVLPRRRGSLHTVGRKPTGTATLCFLLSAGDPYHVHLMQVALRTPAEKLAAPQSGEPRIADPATWAPRRTEKQLWRLCAGNVTDATPRIPTPGGSEHSRRRRQPCCSRALPAGFRDAAFTIVTSRDARVTVAMRRMQGGTSWPAPGLT